MKSLSGKSGQVLLAWRFALTELLGGGGRGYLLSLNDTLSSSSCRSTFALRHGPRCSLPIPVGVVRFRGSSSSSTLAAIILFGTRPAFTVNGAFFSAVLYQTVSCAMQRLARHRTESGSIGDSQLAVLASRGDYDY